MATQRKQGFCKQCDQLRPVTRPGVNHILHLLLSVLTAGLWVIIWILKVIFKGSWRCESCGGSKIKNIS